MRTLTQAMLVAGATLIAGSAIAADMPYYPPVIEIPDVDYGVSGSFYLRGSAAGNLMWAPRVNHPTAIDPAFPIDGFGYGYSVGAGAGYELGNGLRVDATVDYFNNEGMRTTLTTTGAGPLAAGVHTLSLRSTVLLANAYYDFALGGDGYGAAGGMFGYVGGGAGVAFNDFITNGPGFADTRDQNTSFAAAGMIGAGYDFGQVVADIGYRGLYIHDLNNDAAPNPYSIPNNFVHEVRGTVRYRFN
ncbi:hypothetical protein [Devosia rhizoryzae]|uniref:Outer membrane protein beta-barrel domain-containing protein n=1 Tax=Devosia rhizoryzae TaxID=2774137 RepID=A0ABX7C755_9HYPH|nr:hypothetical protein [Devosia rhizoryzae]QQR39613.1 hypothetical protein JI748_00925 [Devosia rhizoryzae]